MNGGREEVLRGQLDETSVGALLVEEGDVGVACRVGSPAEDSGVEGLNAFEVEAGDFVPDDCLVVCKCGNRERLWEREGTNAGGHLLGFFGHWN